MGALGDFLYQHFHSATAAAAATAATALSPLEDWLWRAGQGIVVGVSVWIITHGISALLKKIRCK